MAIDYVSIYSLYILYILYNLYYTLTIVYLLLLNLLFLLFLIFYICFHLFNLVGTSILPLKTVADMFGYSIVAVDVGLDVFFVRNDLLLHTAVLPYDHWGKYTANYTYYDDDGWIAVNKPRLPNYNKCWTEGAGNRRHNHTDLIDSYLIRFDEWLTNGFDIGKAAGGKVFEEVNKFHIVLDRHVP